MTRTLSTAVTAALFAFAVAAPMSAGAVTLVNKDSKDHTVEVVQGGSSQNVTIRAGQTLQNICGDGCTIKGEHDLVENIAGSETLVFSDGGELHYQ